MGCGEKANDSPREGEAFRKVPILEDDILAGIRRIRGSVGGLAVLEY